MMQHHSPHKFPKYSEHQGTSILSFLAGAAAVIAVGGYYLFGPKGEQHRMEVDRWVRKARRDILSKMGDIQDITEDQYHRIVDDTVEKYAGMRDLSISHVERVKANFKARWNEMREAAKRAKEDTRQEMELEERTRTSELETDMERY